jgi:hypothetical protein
MKANTYQSEQGTLQKSMRTLTYGLPWFGLPWLRTKVQTKVGIEKKFRSHIESNTERNLAEMPETLAFLAEIQLSLSGFLRRIEKQHGDDVDTT